ncbi:hypothetical protein [Thalassobaculum sp.]|uniref:hypothetical protein n=1 Tax=Thalassobaculum sp. TaxID=2022740 RepID=UPI0032EEC1E2
MTSVRALMAVLMLGGALGLAACEEEKGPAEKAGAAIDEAVNDTKRAVQDAKD